MPLLDETWLSTSEVARIMGTTNSSVRALCNGDGTGKPDTTPALLNYRLTANKSGVSDAAAEGVYKIAESSVKAYILATQRGDPNDKIKAVAEVLSAMARADIDTAIILAGELRKSRKESARQLGLMQQPVVCTQTTLAI